MRMVFSFLLLMATLGSTGLLFYKILFGRKDEWHLPLALLIFIWIGSSVLFSILNHVFGIRV